LIYPFYTKDVRVISFYSQQNYEPWESLGKLMRPKPARHTQHARHTTAPDMPNFRQALSVISFATFAYLVSYLRNDQPHAPLRNAPDDSMELSTRIVAVGDLHGDIENAQKVLEMAKVVDSDGRWSGEVDVFVQTGDIIDRCVP
jgi:hypothetical protein